MDYEFESSQFPVEGLAEYSTIVETIKPIYGPCLTAPLPWVAPNRGCYRLCHEDHSFGVDVMRTKNPLQHKMLMQKHGSALAGRVGGPQLMQDALQEHAELESAGSVETSKKQDVGLWPVFEALNVLGSQGWSINSNVLRVRLHSLKLEPSQMEAASFCHFEGMFVDQLPCSGPMFSSRMLSDFC